VRSCRWTAERTRAAGRLHRKLVVEVAGRTVVVADIAAVLAGIEIDRHR
jgi:hypothetical protein